jgi:hypothetical protein
MTRRTSTRQLVDDVVVVGFTTRIIGCNILDHFLATSMIRWSCTTFFVFSKLSGLIMIIITEASGWRGGGEPD